MKIGSLIQVMSQDQKVLEESDKSYKSFAENLLRHLMLAGTAGANNDSNKHWRDEVELFQNQLKDKLGMDGKNSKPNKNIYNKLNTEVDEIFIKAKRKLLRHEKMQTNNPIYYEELPDQCPWTADDLLFKNTNELIEMGNKSSNATGTKGLLKLNKKKGY